METETTAALPTGSGFGARLRAAREAAGRTMAEVADKLHCDARVVAALENEELSLLGAAVYARGHIKRYAEYLKLPVAELVALYDQKEDRPENLPDLRRIPQAERARDTNNAWRWVYGVGAGLIGLFAVWAVLQSPRGAGNAPAAPVASPVAAVPQTVRPAPAVVTASPGPAPASLGAASIGAAAVPNTVAVAAPDSPVRLGLRPRADCWTEVYDVEGRQLFFDIAKRGVHQDVSGKGPLKLVLGNAPVMRLELGGKELQVATELQRKGTAFITIAADGHMEAAR
jgi:cytoskeleton protein RodZ